MAPRPEDYPDGDFDEEEINGTEETIGGSSLY